MVGRRGACMPITMGFRSMADRLTAVLLSITMLSERLQLAPSLDAS